MKMAAVCGIVLLLLWGTITSSAESSECKKYVTTGTNVTLPISLEPAQRERLKWKHGETLIFDRKGGDVITGTANDVSQNGSLILTKVQKAQSGLYTPEAFTKDGVLVKNLESTHLCVLDPVPKPEVTQKCLSSKTVVEFTCNVKTTYEVTYKWLQDGKEVKGQNTKSFKSKTKDVETSSISCTASNKASSQMSDSVQQTCIKPGFVFPSEVWGVSVWVFVAGGGGIVLVLILITIVCCIRAKQKKTMRIKDEEELRLGWTNPQQQQHQHQHNHPPNQPHRHHQHHHQQQPAGHTGPRQQRTKQPRPRAPDPINGQPQPNPRRGQLPKPPNDDDDQPPPLPQPRKKGPKTPKV